MIKGLDLLAGATYKTTFANYSEDYAVGVFAEAFGDALPAVDAAMRGGAKLIRVQLIWSDTHSFGDKDLKKMKELAEKYNALAVKHLFRGLHLSPFCEHNIEKPDKYLDTCQSYARNCTIINTPWKGGLSAKYINEIHGDQSVPKGNYFYSFDGLEATNADVEKYKKKHKNAEVFFMWTSRFNLKWSEKDDAKRPQRIKEANVRKPSEEMIDSIAYLFTDKGEYRLGSKTLLKSHSERHNAVDKKGDKLLIITPRKVKELTLKKDGKEIGRIPYYSTYTDGRHRYYSSKMGYIYGPGVEVFAGNVRLGIANCGFRSPPFRG